MTSDRSLVVQLKSRLVGVAIGGVIACDAEPSMHEPRPPAELVDADVWMRTPEALDAYVTRRPAGVMCDPQVGYGSELFGGVPALEINTGWCNFLTVDQPLLADIRPGERLVVSVWHFELWANEPAEAFLGLAIDGEPLWEHRVPIPSESGLVHEAIELDDVYDIGTEVQFHLDNHGLNSWALLSITRDSGDDS